MKKRIVVRSMAAVMLCVSLVPVRPAEAAAQKALSAAINVYVRPGGTSYSFTIPTESGGGSILDIGFQNITDPAFNWILSRAGLQYSTDGGSNWTPYSLQNDNVSSYLSVSGRLWRVVDTTSGDTSTSNSFGNCWHAAATPTSVTCSGGNVVPDNAPTNITSSSLVVFNDATAGSTIATLTPTDTGDTTGGYWAIDSQSVTSLFTLASDTSTGNTASLKLGAGTMPALGQSATVTVRYYDAYQTDSAGAPIGGQGFFKTLTFTVVQDSTTDLTGLSSEFSVNTTTTNTQNQASIARLSNGNIVVAWRSQAQENDTSSNGGIYARIFNSTGSAQTAELRISPLDNVNQTSPSVAALSGGRFVVAYQEASNANDVIYRIVAADNTVGTALTAHAATALSQNNPRVATLSDGNFVIAWVDAANSGDIVARVFDGTNGTAVASEFTVNSTTSGVQSQPDVTALGSGSFVATWRGDANSGDIYARTGNSSGVVSSEFVVVTGSANQTNARVAGFTDGKFVVAWSEPGLDGDASNESNIYFQRYSAANATSGSVVRANNSVLASQTTPTIAGFSDGSFLVGWSSTVQDGELNGVFGRRFTSAGVAQDAADFQINEKRHYSQTAPAVVGGSSGAFAATWVDSAQEGSGTSNSGVEARVFTPTSAPTVTSPTSTAITTTGATLGGNATADGGSAITARGVVYSVTTTNNDPQIGGTGVTNVTAGSGTGTFTAGVTGLSSASGYSFKAYATNAIGTTYTSVSTFTTSAVAPTVTTPTSASITASAATLGGNATSDGGSAITARGVVHSVTTTNNSPTIGGTGVTNVTAGSGTGVFTTAITGLSTATGYSFKAYATNSIGTTYTSVATFTTSAVSPTVTTPTSASVTAGGATLGGNATSDGGSAITARGVVYSVTTTNNSPVIGGTGVTNVTAGSGTGTFTAGITGLSSATGYSFKAYATNAIGTTYTSVATFTTSAVAPTVTTPTSASITASAATLGGNATSDGGSAITARGVVYSVTTTNNDPQIGGSGVTNAAAGSGTGVFTTAITGLSTATGYSFKAYATNAIGTTYTPVSTFSTTSCPTITLAALPNGIVGTAYSSSATASGGTGPYTYSLTSGSLPTDLSRANALISGTPTVPGTYNFQITATDTASPGTCTGSRSYSVVIGSVISPGNLVIREFRSRGPAGIHDEYVEVTNVTSGPLTLATTDGSSGFGIAGQNVGPTCPSGTTQLLATIPNGKTIPAGGFVLLANTTVTTGYSLGNYGGASAATPDATWTNDLCDGSGIGLFNSSSALDATTRLDSVGFVGSTSPYLEGTGITVPGSTGTSEVVFVREAPGGVVQDTGVNSTDFFLGDTAGAAFAPVTARLAAPGPQNATSQVANGITLTFADPAKGATAFPNRYRTTTTATTGTYYFRWKVTNNTGAAITSLRIRVSNVTTLNSPGYVAAGAQADFRLTNSADVAINVPGAVTALGLALEPPPTGLAQKGGYNASASVILPGGTLANGASVYVNVGFFYQQAGSYTYFVTGEAK